MLGLYCIYWIVWDRYMQVPFLGRAPRTKETLPNFLKWRRVTRHPLVFRGFTGSQRTPGFRGVTFSMGILRRRSIWHSFKACETPIICIMFVVYTRLFMGSNKLRRLGTKGSAPSCSSSVLSHPVETCPSLFTPAVMCSSISWFMLTI